PLIECYFGGRLARDLRTAGEAALADFALKEIAATLGAEFVARTRVLQVSGWVSDPFARGSYSHALPGFADAPALLAAPIDARLSFAGEACSPHDFSTAHGAYLTGLAAADTVLGGLGRPA